MRILLPKGDQYAFISQVLQRISIVEAARLCNLSERTIRDWRREKFLMSKVSMLTLSKLTAISAPKHFKEKKDGFTSEQAMIAGRMGSTVCLEKYGCIGGPKRRDRVV